MGHPDSSSSVNNSSQPVSAQEYSKNSHLALIAIGTSFMAIMAVTSPFILMQLRSPLPYMATPGRKVEKALKFIMERKRFSKKRVNVEASITSSSAQNFPREVSSQLRFLDLGSGDGTLVFTAASLHWKSIGVELNPTLWAISSLRRILQPRELRRNCTFIYGDMFHSSLRKEIRNANCVMVFGVSSLMPRIADLIQNECHEGAYIMSYRFRMPLMAGMHSEKGVGSCSIHQAKEKLEQRGAIQALLIYEEEEIHVYEKV